MPQQQDLPHLGDTPPNPLPARLRRGVSQRGQARPLILGQPLPRRTPRPARAPARRRPQRTLDLRAPSSPTRPTLSLPLNPIRLRLVPLRYLVIDQTPPPHHQLWRSFMGSDDWIDLVVGASLNVDEWKS